MLHSHPRAGREEWQTTRSLRLAELAQHGVDRVERRVYLLPHLHTRMEMSVLCNKNPVST